MLLNEHLATTPLRIENGCPMDRAGRYIRVRSFLSGGLLSSMSGEFRAYFLASAGLMGSLRTDE